MLLVQVEEIHSMFPHVSIHTIGIDLNNTNSVTQTVDNILNGAVVNPLDQPHPPPHPRPVIQSLPPRDSSTLDAVLEEPGAQTNTRDIKDTEFSGTVNGLHSSEQRSSSLRLRKGSEKYFEDVKDSSSNCVTSNPGQKPQTTGSNSDNGDLTFEEKKMRLIFEARK